MRRHGTDSCHRGRLFGITYLHLSAHGAFCCFIAWSEASMPEVRIALGFGPWQPEHARLISGEQKERKRLGGQAGQDGQERVEMRCSISCNDWCRL